ncbi:MAG TPA: GH116 family glycosyl hydrolase [Candidatus Eisenbacteria bacterium]|jgi:uncharacterized protein (DUF608 family)|nr:GH116 family glycosyl hydrolase [Candidatus Eisenbacteria bacterium]
MTQFTAKDHVKSGVPLGGIGAGKLEILPNGLFNAFTMQNNWSKPVLGTDDYPGILGYHLAVWCRPLGGRPKALLLQTVSVQNLPTARDVHFEGVFPRASLLFREPRLGLEVKLDVFSPWIPGDVKHSSLPACFFSLTAKNLLRRPVDAAFLFIGRNICGEWCVGRKNRVVEERDYLHLDFSNADPSSRDVRQGALRFSFVKKGWQTSFLESWNAVTRNFSFDSRNISLEAWPSFAEEGRLPDRRSHSIVQGENQELCGAVAARRTIAPGGSSKLSFTASWFFPKHPLGHRYSAWFKGAPEVARYVLPRRKSLEAAQRRVERAVFSLPFPEWFNESLLANLAPFNSSSWFVRDGRFSFYEAPIICPLMGTLDVGFYGSIPLSYFFPELEKSLIRQFADAQRPDGYVPHDLGKNRLDLPSNGTTFHFWKDLNPKFILMVYRDWLWSGDDAFLRGLYPHIKRALAWTKSTDHDGNGLPDNEGADQTFDLWGFFGTNAYTSSIYLAALLATERIAQRLNDAAYARQCRSDFTRGSASFERELWNGRFFGEYCALSQLNGQWYANLLRLGPIVERAKIKKALAAVLRYNSAHSNYGMVNSVLPDGRLDRSNDHSKNIWSGMNYAFMALCISEGFPVAKVLGQARKLWDNVTRVQKNPWNQPDTIDSLTGRYVFGDSYYRNMSIWSIPLARALTDRRTATVLRTLKDFHTKIRPER